ncbi:AI-2E family transporter [Deferribacter autotrophicus]|uniref:AI-2E family transporter n=1 Tax=Deferribacter autotrophicus TaxID=500465 RepID=A0A5A8F492_9BACT|nr:AI-2E family transporter [Deferribacter autotrophicus]KAA0258964.1 AI-2E family transporter [Deferribacter autotrophicus]
MKIIKIELDFKKFLSISLILFLLLLVKKINMILTPFAVAFFIAYLLDPIVDKLESFKINRTLAVLVVFVLFSLLVFMLLMFLIPLLITEINQIVMKVPMYINKLEIKLKGVELYPQYKVYIDEVKNLFLKNLGKISNIMIQILGFLKASVGGMLNWILLYSIVPVLIFYFLKDFDMIVLKLKEVVKKKGHDEFVYKGEQFNKILKSYFRGQFIVSLCLAVMYSVVLLLIGIDGALFIGITAGLLSMVPYLGFVIGFLSSLIFAVVQFQDILHPVLVILGFTIVQIIESNFLTPKIVGESLGLHPVVVIFSIMAGGFLFGISGMIFSLPVAAFIKVQLDDYLQQ